MSDHNRVTALIATVALAVTVSLAACSPEEKTNPEPSITVQEGRAQDSGMQDDNGSESSGAVSKEEAGKIATDKYGGEVTEASNDTYQGKDVWEVEIRNSDQGRVEVKVEKTTGKTLSMEKDDD